MHTKALFSRLMQQQGIKFSASYARQRPSSFNQPFFWMICMKLRKCTGSTGISALFLKNPTVIIHISKNGEHAFTVCEINKPLSGKLDSSCFDGNFSHLSFSHSRAITVFKRNTNLGIVAGDWSTCMSLLLDQIPKSILPSPKLPGCSNN